MPPFGAWLRGRAQPYLAGVAALQDWPNMLSGTRLALDMFEKGGLLICTPDAENPLLKTLIQPDGDVVLTVSTGLLRSAERDRLAAEHQAAIRAALAPLHQLAVNGEVWTNLLLRLPRLALRSTWLSAPFSGGAVLLGDTTLLHLALELGAPMILPASVMLLRPVAGWYVRRRLNRALAEARG